MLSFNRSKKLKRISEPAVHVKPDSKSLSFQGQNLSEFFWKEYAEYCSNIVSFDLSKNSFSKIPQEITLFHNLTSLNLHQNSLDHIPASIFLLTNLRRLTLTNNQITKIPDTIINLEKLQQLRLSGNQILCLPLNLQKLEFLEKLTLSDNPLVFPAGVLCGKINSTFRQLKCGEQLLNVDGVVKLRLGDYKEDYENLETSKKLSWDLKKLYTLNQEFGFAISVVFTANLVQNLRKNMEDRIVVHLDIDEAMLNDPTLLPANFDTIEEIKKRRMEEFSKQKDTDLPPASSPIRNTPREKLESSSPANNQKDDKKVVLSEKTQELELETNEKSYISDDSKGFRREPKKASTIHGRTVPEVRLTSVPPSIPISEAGVCSSPKHDTTPHSSESGSNRKDSSDNGRRVEKSRSSKKERSIHKMKVAHRSSKDEQDSVNESERRVKRFEREHSLKARKTSQEEPRTLVRRRNHSENGDSTDSTTPRDGNHIVDSAQPITKSGKTRPRSSGVVKSTEVHSPPVSPRDNEKISEKKREIQIVPFQSPLHSHRSHTDEINAAFDSRNFANLQRNKPSFGLFGVFDGHGGCGVVSYLEKNLFPAILNQKKKLLIKDYKGSISDAFTQIDESLITLCEKHRDVSGSTAIVSIIDGNYMIVAWLGDSRGILCRGKKAVELSWDHTPLRYDEKKRVEKLGGKVNLNDKRGDAPRVMQSLAVTRAFGDIQLKKWKYIIAEPEFTEIILLPEDQFVVFATDGLWDVLTDEEVISIVHSTDDKLQAGQELVNRAIQTGSKDNISVLVVYFTWVVENL
jgi:serine/threonine protein phosphatase PrpC